MELEAHSSIMMKFADNKVYMQVSWNNSAKRMKLIMPTTKEAKRKTRISKVEKEKEKTLKRQLKNENVDTIVINNNIQAGRLTGRASAERVFAEQRSRVEQSSKTDERTSKDFL